VLNRMYHVWRLEREREGGEPANRMAVKLACVRVYQLLFMLSLLFHKKPLIVNATPFNDDIM